MILEGIVTTQSKAGDVNVAAMGPIVDEELTTLLLRPFNNTQTYLNLKEHPVGVFHVVDDVVLLVQAALNLFEQPPECFPAEKVPGFVLKEACRWYEFEVRELNDECERTEIRGEVVHRGTLKEFWGFHRARHAVIELAITASRLHILEKDFVERQLSEVATIIDKTAGPKERFAFQLVSEYIARTNTKPQSVPSAKDSGST